MIRYLRILQQYLLLGYLFLLSIRTASWRFAYEPVTEKEQTMGLVCRWFGGLCSKGERKSDSVELKVENATLILMSLN